MVESSYQSNNSAEARYYGRLENAESGYNLTRITVNKQMMVELTRPIAMTGFNHFKTMLDNVNLVSAAERQ